jgi:hypothetical protein
LPVLALGGFFFFGGQDILQGGVRLPINLAFSYYFFLMIEFYLLVKNISP